MSPFTVKFSIYPTLDWRIQNSYVQMDLFCFHELCIRPCTPNFELFHGGLLFLWCKYTMHRGEEFHLYIAILDVPIQGWVYGKLYMYHEGT